MFIRPMLRLALVLCLFAAPMTLAAESAPMTAAARTEAACPLFTGQVTHPLSAAERRALMQKLTFAPGMPAEARERILLALEEALRYPAGREQARVLLATGRCYPIGLADNLGAFGSGGSEGVVLDARTLGDLQQAASTLLHELCHVRQNRNCPATCAHETATYLLIQEAEAKAVGWEWFLETGTPGDRMLAAYYARCLAFWQEVAQGQRALPDGFPPLSPAEGLDEAQLAEARRAWAQQMALFDTRARIIRDFTTPLPAADEQMASYFVLASQLEYRSLHFGLILQNGRHPRAFREAGRSDYAIPESVWQGNPLFLSRAELARAYEGPAITTCRQDIRELFAEAAQRCAGQGGMSFTQACEQLLAEKAAGSVVTPRDCVQLARLCQQASYCLGQGDAAGLDAAVQQLRTLIGNERLPGAEILLPRP